MNHHQQTLLFLALLGSIHSTVLAADIDMAPVAKQLEQRIPDVVQPDSDIAQQHAFRSILLAESAAQAAKVTYSPEYLMENLEELEVLLARLLVLGNSEGLKVLLPLYAQVPIRDPYVIDWGEAIIAMEEGRTEDAVQAYRLLIAALPDNEMLRFQLAIALFRNSELIAAKDQFQKLRASTLGAEELETIEAYITMIDRRDEWELYGSLSYISNDNIGNSVPQGTKITLPNGGVFTANEAIESASGIAYSLGADKTWSLSDNLYGALHLSSSGNFYFDNKKYNDFLGSIGVGLGYRTARLDVELNPYFQKRWYAQGSSGNGNLKPYSQHLGLRLNARYWLSPNWQYQGAIQYAEDKYTKDYQHVDGGNVLLSNTIMFMPNQKQYFYGGIDYNHKSAKNKANAYDRYGLRLGWGQEWPKGISTSLSASYGVKKTKGVDFLNIKRKDKEFGTSVSLWHRNFYVFGITPRLVYTYDKTKSNNPFYEYDNSKFFIDFRKTF